MKREDAKISLLRIVLEKAKITIATHCIQIKNVRDMLVESAATLKLTETIDEDAVAIQAARDCAQDKLHDKNKALQAENEALREKIERFKKIVDAPPSGEASPYKTPKYGQCGRDISAKAPPSGRPVKMMFEKPNENEVKRTVGKMMRPPVLQYKGGRSIYVCGRAIKCSKKQMLAFKSNILFSAPADNPDSLLSNTPADLLALDGVGPALVEKIRNALNAGGKKLKDEGYQGIMYWHKIAEKARRR